MTVVEKKKRQQEESRNERPDGDESDWPHLGCADSHEQEGSTPECREHHELKQLPQVHVPNPATRLSS
jgi:hypothetical protein